MGLGLGVFPVQDLAIINGWDLTCDKALRHVETGKQCLDETRLFSVFVGFKHSNQWIGLKEKMQDPPSHISWENLWFTVDFPLSQSIEPRRSGRFKAPSSFWNPLKMFFRSQIGRYLAPFAYAVVSSSYGFKVAVFLSLEPRAIKIEVSSSSKVEIWWIDIQPPSILTH